MNAKLLLNLILLVVLVALIGVAFYEPGKEEPKILRLAEVNTDSLNRFELRNQDTLVFEKRDNAWWLVAPFSAPASEGRVRQLFDVAKTESQARYPLKPEELAKFELDKPKAVLTLGQTRLAFGGFEPIDQLRYVQVGDTLHLVTDDFSHHLLAKPTDFVDKKLLPEDVAIKEIFLPGLKAKLGEQGQWYLEPPGDSAAMAELASAWQSARAIEVSRFEQTPQGDVVRIGLSDGKSLEYAIVQREPDLLLVRSDLKLQYMLAAETGKRLLSLQKPQEGPAPKQDNEGKEAPEEDDNGRSQEEPVEGEPQLDEAD